ncbi:MAG: transposase, partial [Bacteroidales bacterium]|nr:transposase [Bacteroidales bacterium]
PNHAPFVALGNFVVMPNHIHGILILDKPNGEMDNVKNNDVGTLHPVGTLHATSLQQQQQQQQTTSQPPQQPELQSPYNEQMAKISPKSGSISTIIRSYKSAVTKHANRLGLENGWQERFHDHIIRNNAEYQRISDYIINNPANWKNDKFKSL